MKFDLIVYTHSDYADVWPIYFGQSKKYFPNAEKVCFVNKEDSRIPDDHRVIIYNDKLTYRERVLFCLTQMNSDYIIFHHEDMFLYDEPDKIRILNYRTILGLEPNKSFVKLIRGGMQEGESSNYYQELKHIDKTFEYIFAIQPSIWKFENFKKVFKYGKGDNIWQFEVDAQRVCGERNIMGYYVDDDGIKRGKFHWDSKVYPYVATGIVKGKWNFLEYKEELTKLLKEYNIDYKTRGTNAE